MLARPVKVLLLAGLGSAGVFAQSQGSAMLDTPKQLTSPATPPPVPVSLEMRGDIFMARKQYREAIETYQQGPTKDPVLRNKIGIAYHQMLDLNSARKYYESALKIKPDYFEAMNNLGTVYYAKKSYRRAISWYNKALRV